MAHAEDATNMTLDVAGNDSNGTRGDPMLDINWKPFDHAAAAISFLLFVAIVSLNGLVIYVLLFKAQKKSRLFYFVLHLAIADCLVGVVCVLGDGIQSAMYGEWHGGDVICRLWRYGKTVTIIASNNILIGMSVDRFLAIKYPLNSVRAGCCRVLDKAMVFGAWLISLVAACIFILYSKGINSDPKGSTMMEIKGVCDIDIPNEWWKPYIILVSLLVYILPTLGISTCYVGICIVIWRKWRSGRKLSEISKGTSSDKLHRNQSPNAGLLPKAKIKSIKLTLVICIAFFICWTPYFVIMLMSVHNPKSIDPRVFLIFGMLYPLNSAANPLIFLIFNLKLFYRRREEHSYDVVTTQVTST